MEKIKTDWVISPLKKVIRLKSGITIPKDFEKRVGDVPFVRVSDFNIPGNEIFISSSSTYSETFQGIERQLIPVNSIIFPKRGGAIATNKKRITTKEILIDLNTMAAICLPELDAEFFFFWFKLIDLGDLDGGSSSVPQINNNDIYNLSIYHPREKREQQYIAAEIKEKLTSIEQMRQAALQQKGAVEAMQGALLRNIFPYKKGDDLPEGWIWEKIGNILEEEKKQVQPYDDGFKELPFIGLENIVSHTREYTNEEYNPPSSTCFRFTERNVLYGKLRPYLNKVFLPKENGKCTMETLPLIPLNGYSREFVAAVLQSESVIGNTVKFSTGGRMPRADIKKLKKLKVAIPSDAVAANALGLRVEEKIKELISMRKTTSIQLEAIEALPAAVLREVFEMKEHLIEQ